MVRFLKNDPFQRQRRDLEPLHGPPRHQRGGVIALWMFVSVGLLALSRLDHSLVRDGRTVLAEATAPLLAAAMVPFRPVQQSVRTLAGLFELQQEAERLREENQRLKSWEARAKELERRMLLVDDIARVVPERSLSFKTARVIADSGGPFVRTALLDAGRDSGFKNGLPVINVDGLVGRITGSGNRSSRVLLLTDLNSRVPVYIGAGSVRAMMLGDNGPFPKLAHMPADAKIEPGDDVVTSGVGGIFPRGLRIGTLVDGGDQWRVELNARLDRLEYVSILFFDGPGAIAIDDDLSEQRTPARRRSSPQPAAETGGVTQ